MKLRLALAGVTAVTLLAGCAGGPGYFGGGGVAVGYGYDGYYDGTYGPIYDGYWRGNAFYYRDRADHPFRRDTAHHFRTQPANGFQHIQGTRQADAKPG
jgi:hypothetical protein